jgi:hypothetical protein
VALDDEIESALDAIPAAWGISADGETRPRAGRNPVSAALPAAWLTEIPGVSLKFPSRSSPRRAWTFTADHLVSWADLAPVARQPSPRSRRPGKGQSDAYLKDHGTQAAISTARAGTFRGEQCRRPSRRIGALRARCAFARSILVIVWHLLHDPAARCRDHGADWYERHSDRDRKIRAHLRQLQALGLDVTIAPAVA